VKRLVPFLIAAAAGATALYGCSQYPIEPGDGPAASAGPDQTVTDTDGDGAETVSFDGSGSHSGATITSWIWTDGDVEIAQGEAPSVAMPVGAYVIRLTVTDADGNIAVDDVLITVLAASGPIADAGTDRTVTDSDGNGVESVLLNGSASRDPEHGISGYVWRRAGAQIGTGVAPTVILGVGTHTITLTVTNDIGDSASDDVVVTVLAGGGNGGGNQPPVADAGPDQIVTDGDGNGSESVTMDGSGSYDPDGSLQYGEWFENGQQIGNGAHANLTLVVGVHTITLRVVDDQGAEGTDDVIITVNASGSGNQGPTAHAGADQTVTDSDGGGSETVTLDGSGSFDPDGSLTAWVWRKNGTQIATGATPTVSLAVGTHTIVLTVTDDGGLTDSDTVVITVSAGTVPISFSGDIQPYLTANCTSCHGGGSGPLGVNLDSYAAVMAGGQLGPIVVPYDPTQGSLLKELKQGHHGAPHGTNIIADVTSWVDDGAPNN
jgi:hypothetical protein